MGVCERVHKRLHLIALTLVLLVFFSVLATAFWNVLFGVPAPAMDYGQVKPQQGCHYYTPSECCADPGCTWDGTCNPGSGCATSSTTSSTTTSSTTTVKPVVTLVSPGNNDNAPTPVIFQADVTDSERREHRSLHRHGKCL